MLFTAGKGRTNGTCSECQVWCFVSKIPKKSKDVVLETSRSFQDLRHYLMDQIFGYPSSNVGSVLLSQEFETKPSLPISSWLALRAYYLTGSLLSYLLHTLSSSLRVKAQQASAGCCRWAWTRSPDYHCSYCPLAEELGCESTLVSWRPEPELLVDQSGRSQWLSSQTSCLPGGHNW